MIASAEKIWDCSTATDNPSHFLHKKWNIFPVSFAREIALDVFFYILLQ